MGEELNGFSRSFHTFWNFVNISSRYAGSFASTKPSCNFVGLLIMSSTNSLVTPAGILTGLVFNVPFKVQKAPNMNSFRK